MMRLVWLPRADQARRQAVDYIAQDDPAAALRLLDGIGRLCGLLCDYPEMGRVGRVAGTREMVISRTPFILVYRIGDDAIQIIHLLHGAQQWP